MKMSMAFVALLAVAASIWFVLKPGPDEEIRASYPNEQLSAVSNAVQQAEQRTAPAVEQQDVASLSDPVKSDFGECAPLDAAEREKLVVVAQDWYGEHGDAKSRRYWPYQSMDNHTLEQMADQGDAEAMFQLGMNMLWQATRTEGDRWQPEGSVLFDATPRRDEVILDAFMKADRLFYDAVKRGKVFAYRAWVATMVEYPALYDRLGLGLGNETGFSDRESRDIWMAAFGIAENYFVPDLPTERVIVELDDRARKAAEELAVVIHGGALARRTVRAMSVPKVSPPAAVYQLAEDNRCIEAQVRRTGSP